eukprot:IDg14188t1
MEHAAAHFELLETAYKKYSITSPAQMFNLNETGFVIRENAKIRKRTKLVVPARKRSQFISMKYRDSVDHINLMSVVSADGSIGGWQSMESRCSLSGRKASRTENTELGESHHSWPPSVLIAGFTVHPC